MEKLKNTELEIWDQYAAAALAYSSSLLREGHTMKPSDAARVAAEVADQLILERRSRKQSTTALPINLKM